MNDEVAEIKHRLDIIEIVSGYLTLKKAGAYLKAPCPFHNEKTPSFMVSPERQSFKCFGCGEGGDIFTFVEKMEGLDFFNALKLLADRAGVPLKQQSVTYGNKEHKADRKTRLYEINDWAKKLYHKLLLDHPKAEHARKYLEGRGITNKTIREFEIGYAPDSWDLLLKFLKQKGYSEEDAAEAGVAVRREKGGCYDRFRGRITFPINNVMGATIAFTSRVLKDDAKEAKYLNSSDSPIYIKGEVIFGLDKARSAIREADLVVVVEGQMDVIACHQAGFKNVIATSGTALTEHQLKNLSRYASIVAFCFDGDSAGETAMKRAIGMAVKNDISSKIIAVPPPYKDPDEAIKADPKNWVRAVERARPSVEYWIDLLVRKDPDLPVTAKKKIAKEILPVVKSTYSPIEKESNLRYLSKKLAISEQSLLDALEQTKGDQPGTAPNEKEASPVKSSLSPVERILALLWLDPGLIKLLPEHIEVADKVMELKQFSEMITERKIDKTGVDQKESGILDQMAIALSDSIDINDEEARKAEFTFLFKRFQSDEREQLKEEFAAKIKAAEEAGDSAKLKDLLKEFSGLIK